MHTGADIYLEDWPRLRGATGQVSAALNLQAKVRLCPRWSGDVQQGRMPAAARDLKGFDQKHSCRPAFGAGLEVSSVHFREHVYI
jgi:hypothetical protein